MNGTPDSGDLWRLALEHSPVGMTLVGLDGRLLAVNRALCEMLGYDAGELTSRRFHDVTHPEDLDQGVELFEQVLAGTIDSYRLLKRYLRADGAVVWGDLSVALVREPDGTPLHFISQILDVTEQRESEQRLAAANAELERERQTLQAIFDTVDVGLLLIDRDGRYQRMNRRHAETMSMPFPEGHAGEAGQLGQVYFPDGKTPMGREDMPSYRAVQGEEFDDLWYWVGSDPATRAAFTTSARTLRGPSGEMTGAVLAYQDITEQIRTLQVKDEFVASVSHELRTPITSVLGYLELLCERDDLPPEVTSQLAVVERNALRLRTLVSDLLHVAQARAGTLQVQRTEVDLSLLVREAVEAARPQAESAGIDLVLDVPQRLPAFLDGERLRQVVDNLVSNAVKYTERDGSVSVALAQQGHQVELIVSDTGIGIDDAAVEQVFARFFRGDAALQRQIPGTGLGLNIAHSIIAAHGGSLRLESKLGEGSTFRVTLPHAVV